MKVTMFKRGSTWWAQWRKDGVRTRRSLRTSNWKIAEEMRIELEYQLLRGELPAEKPRVPIAQLVAEYEAWSKANKRPKTVVNDRGRIQRFRDHGNPEFVDDVTTKSVMDYFSHRAVEDSVGPTTILREREILHAMMNFAVRVGYVDVNPVSRVPRPKIPDPEPRFLSRDQIEKLLAAVAGDEIEPVVATAVYAGLRREELCWLMPKDLEAVGDGQLLRVRRKVVDGEEWMPKTKRNRAVPVSKALARILRGHHRHGAQWLFPSPGGCRWDPDNLSRRFRKLMKKAGLPWSLLDLRHTFGSQLAMRDRSLIKIAQMMGNSPEIARRHYINLMPGEMMADVEF